MGRLNRILDANYDTSNIDKEVNKMNHLTDIKKVALKALLKCHEEFFDGQLGKWKCDPVEIKLKEGATPP